MSGNWDQYINCVYIEENNSLQILIELPPPTFKLTLFEINIFKDDGLNGITDRSINSSLFNVHHDQSHIFNHGYIIWVSSWTISGSVCHLYINDFLTFIKWNNCGIDIGNKKVYIVLY
jgi:hypothetical protein